MSEWQDIETAPEGMDILVYDPLDDVHPVKSDSYVWVTETVSTLESESINSKGVRRIIQESQNTRREWRESIDPEKWQPLPEPPK